MSVKGKIAIIGIGEVPTGDFPQRTAVEIALESSIQAIKNAGINKDEIDVIMSTGALYDRLIFEIEMSTGRLAEELGLLGKLKSNVEIFSGGSSSSSSLQSAIGLILTGQAETVLCVHSDKLGTGISLEDVKVLFNNAVNSSEWELPYGFGGISLCDFMMNRYMYETGTTLEQIASVVVSNRKWAQLNPNAARRDPITVEEIMSSLKLSTTVNLGQMYGKFYDGGCAFIVTSAENAKKYNDKPVYVLGEASYVSHCLISTAPDLTHFTYAKTAKEAFAAAGLTPQDMDFAQIYEAMSIIQLIAFEELGFVERGKGGEFFAAGHAAPGGKIPVTTNGGMLSQGHTGAGGGYALLVEAVRQLKGEAGERQIPNAKYGVYTGTGGAFSDTYVTVLGTQIP